MRYTKKFIQARFEMAMDACGLPHGPTYESGKAVVGTYACGYYYGWQITRIVNERGGESCPFGSGRYNAREFVAMLDGIIGAARAVCSKHDVSDMKYLGTRDDF